MAKWPAISVPKLASEARIRVGVDRVYISFTLDPSDPNYVPGM